MDAARGPSFAADQDEGPQRGSGRPIPPLVSKIQVATTNAGARARGGLTPDFLALSAEAPLADWANPGQRALDTAIREINKKTDLNIALESLVRSKHRRVTTVIFAIREQAVPNSD